jgi:hypothetical protein
MGLDGPAGQVQPQGDGLVVQALAQQAQHLALARGQRHLPQGVGHHAGGTAAQVAPPRRHGQGCALQLVHAALHIQVAQGPGRQGLAHRLAAVVGFGHHQPAQPRRLRQPIQGLGMAADHQFETPAGQRRPQLRARAGGHLAAGGHRRRDAGAQQGTAVADQRLR